MYQLYKSLSESVQPISDSPVEVLTLCPCPPETLSCAVKCDLDEVDGGILSYPPVNGTSVPSNLE